MSVSAPTLYEYYTGSGITNGVSINQPYFTLNDKNITLYSGAMHYFRVPKPYWRDRLKKMRAAGLNTVETYVPWNLHEPQMGFFDFGNGGSDMEEFLDLEHFIKLAKEEDLFVLVRPGPYICAEWDFGGLPSWLLREKDIKIRTSDEKFMNHVTRFFSKLLPILAALQFTKNGSIIGFQVENEYGSTEWKKGNRSFVPDKEYLKQLKNLMLQNGIKELLYTSDSPSQHGSRGSLPELFQTANFARNPRKEFDKLKELQPRKPLMAMEFWTGWFDHWSETHHLRNNKEFKQVLNEILIYPASVNFYMFVGGTNWGFLNGANLEGNKQIYQPDTTSYDYDAPISENGDYTEKYEIVKELIKKYNKIETKLPTPPPENPRYKYPSIEIQQQLQFMEIIDQLPLISDYSDLKPMEMLPVHQSFGYVNYRKTVDIPAKSVLKLGGYVRDSALVLINGVLLSSPLKSSTDLSKFGYWILKDGTINLPETHNATLDIIFENWGRNNYGKLEQFQQFKGFCDGVFLNGKELKNWNISSLEFTKNWTKHLTNWKNYLSTNMTLNRVEFEISEAFDTYIDMSRWNTGIVIVNNFVLGRHMHLGPQQTLYLPAPLLNIGKNEILIFEHFLPYTHLEFSKNPTYFTKY